MAVKKPPGVASDPFKSAKWDEITAGRRFKPSDAPVLTLLVQWYAIVEQCMDDITETDGGTQVVYVNDMNDLKAMPQIATMKQASAEIRQLNKQLGIDDEAGAVSDGDVGSAGNIVDFAKRNRQDRRARAAG